MQGKLALVTGGSRGIGAATALALAQCGFRVCVNYHNSADQAEEVVRKALELGAPWAKAYRADIGDRVQARAMIEQIHQEQGPIAILVNNAGIIDDAPFTTMTDEQWDRVLAVNLTGVFVVTRAVIGDMKKARWGRIINVSSITGQKGGKAQANYAAAKGGLIAFSKTLAEELGGRNVTVNVVAPGFIDTDMMQTVGLVMIGEIAKRSPVGRIGRPEEVAALIAFLAGEEAGFTTGQVIGVNGGLY